MKNREKLEKNIYVENFCENVWCVEFGCRRRVIMKMRTCKLKL